MRRDALAPVGTALLALLLLSAPAPALGQSPAHNSFEGLQPSWQSGDADARYRIERQLRVRDDPHSGHWCEYIRVAAGQGTHVYLEHAIEPAHVIDELAPSLWIKSDRAGLQLLARVVLPRTLAPTSGMPITALVRGQKYSSPGRWQALSIPEIPKLLSREARFLRHTLGTDVDTREAYIDRLVLNVHDRSGRVNVWIDDMRIDGFVHRQAPSSTSLGRATPGGRHAILAAYAMPIADAVLPLGGSPTAGRRPAPKITVQGQLLLINDRPFFPRMIQHQGEPLTFLKRIGFNTIQLGRPPSAQLLAEAAELNLWLVCPPPRTMDPASPAATNRLPPFGPEYDVVVAWDLGSGLSERHLEDTRRWAKEVRLADGRVSRPLVCNALAQLRAFSRTVDVLSIHRSPLGSSLELDDYATWLRERPRLAKPGIPLWIAVQTQLPESLVAQQAALAGGKERSLYAPSEQIRLLAYTALAAGARGICFQSTSRLDSHDPNTQHRARMLELLNLEFALVAPWAAEGQFISTVSGSEPEVKGAVLKAGRTRLVLPIWTDVGAQFVPGQSAGHSVSVVVRGAPESSKAYEITPAGLKLLWPQRAAGGVRVTLEEFGLTSLVILTDDPRVPQQMRQRMSMIQQRAAQLQRDLAADKLRTVTDVDRRLSAYGRQVIQAASLLSTAQESLAQCDQELKQAEFSVAYLTARRAMRPLRLLEKAHWEQAVERLSSPVATPFAVAFSTLPEHWAMMANLGAARDSGNRLLGGDFESAVRIRRAGWTHLQHQQLGITSEAELTSEASHTGLAGLKLIATPTDASRPPKLVENSPIWVRTPPVPLSAGQVVRIHGWVNVPQTIQGSTDGVLIIDSLAGPALAARIKKTALWQEFVMYRAAPETTELTVTFALTGVGECWIDDVTISLLDPSARLPANQARLRSGRGAASFTRRR